jgi:hypothetical protein
MVLQHQVTEVPNGVHISGTAPLLFPLCLHHHQNSTSSIGVELASFIPVLFLFLCCIPQLSLGSQVQSQKYSKEWKF